MAVSQAERIAMVRAEDKGARVVKHHASGAITIRYRQRWQSGWHRHGRNMPISSSGDLRRYVYVILPDGRLLGYTNANPERLTPVERRRHADALALITRPTRPTKSRGPQTGGKARPKPNRRPTTATRADSAKRAATFVSPEPPSVQRVRPEEAGTDEYIVSVPEQRKARRREAALVRRYEAHLDELGLAHDRLCMQLEGVRLWNDIFVADRHQLLEAKAGVSREDARMAIGQIKDYLFRIAREELFAADPSPAVLFPERPRDSIVELLDSLGIATVWEEDRGFVDNRGGAFTFQTAFPTPGP